MDYGRYKYEQSKKDKESHRKQKSGDLKGVYLRPRTDDHDLEFKLKNAVKFLMDGDKVKFTVRFRSREITHPEFGRDLLGQVAKALEGVAVIEKPAGMEGRTMTMIVAPKQAAGT